MDVPVIGAPAQLSHAPWTVLGHRADGRPIYTIAGSSGDDDDIEIDDGGDEEPDGAEVEEPDDGPDGEDDKPKPGPLKNPDLEKLQAEHARTVAALKKANEEAKRSRLALKERETKDRANEGDHEKAIREAREESETRWKPRIINQAARAALAEAGVNGGPERVLKLIDPDALSVDDEGDVIGLPSEVDRLRDQYPELFTKAEAGRPRPKARPTGAPKPAAPAKPKNSWDRHADRALNGN